jgi:hypothetical protein
MSRPIQVDVAALRRLGADLAGLAAQLTADNNGLGDRVEDPYIGMALKDIQHDWSKRRKVITDYLTGAAQAVQAAAHGYGQAEATITRAASMGGSR